MIPFDWNIEYRASTFGEAHQKLTQIGRLDLFQNRAAEAILNDMREKLRSLEWILDETRRYSGIAMETGGRWSALGRTPGADANLLAHLASETSDYSKRAAVQAEQFYILAFLIVERARVISKMLGVSTSAREPRPITLMRNNAIIHPEKAKMTETIAFEFDPNGSGVRMSRLRMDGTSLESSGIEDDAAALTRYIDEWSTELETSSRYPWDTGAGQD